MLCGGAFSIQVIRRVVAPKSNCISGGDLSTMAAHGIYTFATFGLIFRWWNGSISGNHSNHLASVCLNFVFPKYQLPTLRNEKVIRHHASVSMIPKFRKLEFFENIDVGGPFW